MLQETSNSETDSIESREIDMKEEVSTSDTEDVGIDSEKGMQVQNADINTGISYSFVTST